MTLQAELRAKILTDIITRQSNFNGRYEIKVNNVYNPRICVNYSVNDGTEFVLEKEGSVYWKQYPLKNAFEDCMLAKSREDLAVRSVMGMCNREIWAKPLYFGKLKKYVKELHSSEVNEVSPKYQNCQYEESVYVTSVGTRRLYIDELGRLFVKLNGVPWHLSEVDVKNISLAA